MALCGCCTVRDDDTVENIEQLKRMHLRRTGGLFDCYLGTTPADRRGQRCSKLYNSTKVDKYDSDNSISDHTSNTNEGFSVRHNTTYAEDDPVPLHLRMGVAARARISAEGQK